MSNSNFVSVTDVLGDVTKAVKSNSTFKGKNLLIKGEIITIDRTANGRVNASGEKIETYVVQLQGADDKEPQLCFCDVERAFGINETSIGTVVQGEIIENIAEKDFTKVKKGDKVVFTRSLKRVETSKADERIAFIHACKEAGVAVVGF